MNRREETAKELKIGEVEKDLLLQVMTFATLLDDNINGKEAIDLVEFASQCNTSLAKKLKSLSSIRMLKNQGWNHKQDLSALISNLAGLLSDASLFDNYKDIKKLFAQYGNDLVEVKPSTPLSKIEKVYFSSYDYAAQYYPEDQKGRKQSQEEKYANLMYLTNQLSHLFELKMDKNDTGLSKDQLINIVRGLRKIKDWCIHQIIELKQKGKLIDICLRTDNNSSGLYNSIIDISLPNYYAPFSVYLDSDMLSEKEKEACTGTERYLSKGLKLTFAQYLTDEKMQLLEEVYKGKFHNKNATYERGLRLDWLFETRDILKNMQTKQQLKNNPSEAKIKVSASPENTKAIKIQRENALVLENLEQALGIKFPEYFRTGFLERTSYSIQQFINIVKEPIIEKLKAQNIPKEEQEKEFAKLIVYMKITEPLSVISLKSKDYKVQKAIECMPKSNAAYEFITSILENETEFSSVKSKTRAYANTELNMQSTTQVLNEITDEGKEPENSTEDSLITITTAERDTMVNEIENLSIAVDLLSEELSTVMEELKQTNAKLQQIKEHLSSQQTNGTKNPDAHGGNVEHDK